MALEGFWKALEGSLTRASSVGQELSRTVVSSPSWEAWATRWICWPRKSAMRIKAIVIPGSTDLALQLVKILTGKASFLLSVAILKSWTIGSMETSSCNYAKRKESCISWRPAVYWKGRERETARNREAKRDTRSSLKTCCLLKVLALWKRPTPWSSWLRLRSESLKEIQDLRTKEESQQESRVAPWRWLDEKRMIPMAQKVQWESRRSWFRPKWSLLCNGSKEGRKSSQSSLESLESLAAERLRNHWAAESVERLRLTVLAIECILRE